MAKQVGHYGRMTCMDTIWLGDEEYHDQPSFSCRLEAGHLEQGIPHECAGQAFGRSPRGRYAVPAFKLVWQDHKDTVFCANCDAPFKLGRDESAPNPCPHCGQDIRIAPELRYYAIAPKALR